MKARPIYISRSAYSEIIEGLRPEERFLDLPGLVLITPNGSEVAFCPKEQPPVAAGITDPTKD